MKVQVLFQFAFLLMPSPHHLDLSNCTWLCIIIPIIFLICFYLHMVSSSLLPLPITSTFYLHLLLKLKFPLLLHVLLSTIYSLFLMLLLIQILCLYNFSTHSVTHQPYLPLLLKLPSWLTSSCSYTSSYSPPYQFYSMHCVYVPVCHSLPPPHSTTMNLLCLGYSSSRTPHSTTNKMEMYAQCGKANIYQFNYLLLKSSWYYFPTNLALSCQCTHYFSYSLSYSHQPPLAYVFPVWIPPSSLPFKTIETHVCYTYETHSSFTTYNSSNK